jgi:PAS domain S-box-containing protein
MVESNEQKRADWAVENGERFRATFEQAAVGMALVGLDGRFLEANRTLCDIVSYDHAVLNGLALRDITHPDDIESDLTDARRLLAGDISAYTAQKRYVRKDKSLVCVKLNVSLARNAKGQPAHFIFAIENIANRAMGEDVFRTLTDSIPHLWLDGRPRGLHPLVQPTLVRLYRQNAGADVGLQVVSCP